MKKRRLLISICQILSLTLLFFITGCGKKNKTKATTKTNTTTTSEHVHDFGEWKTYVTPTCTEEGLKKATCSCGMVLTEIIPTIDHTYVDDKCSVCGHEKLTDGFNIFYSELDEYYHIDDYTGTSTTVRIPYLYDDGENGDHKIYIDKESVFGAFESKLKDCNIKTIILGKGYETIPENMFLGLNNLEEVVLNKDVRRIMDNAFYNCPKLSSVKFNEEIEYIGLYAFSKCNLSSFTAPYNLETIEDGAFAYNVDMDSITLGNNVESVGDNAFSGTKLTSIHIPYSLKEFGGHEDLSYLTTITIDPRNSIFEFKNGLLVNKNENKLIKALTLSEIPEDIEYIESYAFENLDFSSTDSFVIPSTVKYIGFRAFKNAIFNNLTINEGLIYIAEEAFSAISFTNGDDITITLPSSVNIIEYHAFMEAEFFKIIIPSSVVKLGDEVFKDCLISTIDINIYTVDSPDCSPYWDSGIDLDITTINIINE